MAGQNHHFAGYAPEKIPYAIERYVNETNRLYGVLDRRLADRDFIAGDYSIADMACYPWIVPWERQGQNLDDFPQPEALVRGDRGRGRRPSRAYAQGRGRPIRPPMSARSEEDPVRPDRRDHRRAWPRGGRLTSATKEARMLDALRRLVNEFTSAPAAFDPRDYRVASAALLIHVATADGVMDAQEQRRLSTLIETRYGLDQVGAQELIAEAERQDAEAVNLSDFTDVLRRSLDLDDRKGLVAMLWDVARADGSIHEFEEGLVLRAAKLMGVAAADAEALRAGAAQGTPGPALPKG